MKTAHVSGIILPQTPAQLTQIQRRCKIFGCLGLTLWELHTSFWRCVKYIKTAQVYPKHLLIYPNTMYVGVNIWSWKKHMIVWILKILKYEHTHQDFTHFVANTNKSQFTRFWGKFWTQLFVCVKTLTLCNSADCMHFCFCWSMQFAQLKEKEEVVNLRDMGRWRGYWWPIHHSYFPL